MAITPNRVQSLRTKNALQNPDGKSWVEILQRVLDNDTYDLRDRGISKGWEIRLMFPSKIYVYEFQDALIKNNSYFDNRFNNLVVCVSVGDLISLIFAEINGVVPEKDIENLALFQKVFQDPLEELENNDFRKGIKEILDQKNKSIAEAQVRTGLASALGSLAGSLGASFFSNVFSNISGMIKGVVSSCDAPSKDVSESLIKICSRLAKKFSEKRFLE